jgi:SAM-dependent methyltransferase
MSGTEMGSFWDRRAEEDAFYFVDNRLTYGQPELDRFWAGGQRDVDGILSALDTGISPNDDVVEIGCGVGRLTRVLARQARSVVALDVSERMLAAAREHNTELMNVEWLQGDGSSLSGVADASADLCFSHVVFQHIPDPDITLAYVREMGRVLRPGGAAAFHVSNDPSKHGARRGPSMLRTRALALLGRAPRGQRDRAWLGSAVDLHDLRAAADAGGMDVERVVGEGTQYCLVLARRR